MGRFLKSRHPDIWMQLQVPRDYPRGSDYLWEQWREGASSRKVVDSWIQKCQAKGLPLYGVPSGRTISDGDAGRQQGMERGGDVWKLPLAARLQIVSFWRSELCEEWAAELAEQLEAADKLQQEKWALRDRGCEQVLAGARVIGCTTTGADMVKSLLSSA